MGQLNPFGQKIKNKLLLIVGTEQSGKNSLVKRLKDLDESKKQMNGLSLEETKYKNCQFIIADIFRNTRVQQYQKHENQLSFDGIFVFIIDSSEVNQVVEFYKIFQNFERIINEKNKPLLIYINKQDISTVSTEQVKTIIQLNKITNKHIHLQPCNALTGEGVKEGIEWLYNQII